MVRLLSATLLLAPFVAGSPVVARVAEARPISQETDTKQIVSGTYFERDVLSKNDTPEVLRRVLRKEPYAHLSAEEYVALLEDTVHDFPLSRVAHETLANELIGHSTEESGPAFEQGVQELTKAADLSFREGFVRYQPQLPHYLAVTHNEAGLHDYIQRALALLPEEQDRYSVYVTSANALAELGNPLADEMYRKAVATEPLGAWDAYEFYAFYLKRNKQYEKLLDLVTPSLLRQAFIIAPILQPVRCEALRATGRISEARVECEDKAVRQSPGRFATARLG